MKELKRFKKVSLETGEKKEVVIECGREAFSYWDERRDSWVAPKGTYKVLVRASSDNHPLVGEAVLEKRFMWSGL